MKRKQGGRGRLPFAALVALSALLAMACGGGGATKGATSSAPPQATQAAAVATSAATTAASAPDAKPGRQASIGAVLSLTGTAAVFGQSQQKGIELAVNEINTNNTVPGVKMTLTVEDDAGDRNQGINAFNKLIGANVHAIIGPTLSNTALSTNPVAQEKKVPVLGVSNTAAGITDIGDYIFRDSLTEGDVIPQTVKKVAEKVKPKRAALLFANDDAFSKSGGDTMRDALKANGIEIVTEQQFSTNDKDFRAQLTAVRNANPDVVFVSALIGPAIGIVTQARELGIRAPIAGGNGFNTPELSKQAGEAAEGVVVGAAWNQASTAPKSQDFLKAYKAKYNADPDQFAAQAYTGVYILAEAVKRAGDLDRAAIRAALPTVKDLDTPLGKFSFNEKRDAQHSAVVQVVKGGKLVVYE
ncbi:MAG: ABC transporter substrate-binding protein [Dehalococcoidia bacterium]